MKRALAIGFVALALLGGVLAYRTSRLPQPAAPPPGGALVPIDADAAAERLARAIRIPTISVADGQPAEPATLAAFGQLLKTAFPKTHAGLVREAVNGASLLYAWPGTALDASPILLAAHMDVVPVEPGSEARWQQPPFAGAIAGGYIWGRGALDDKASLMAQLEAVEYLLGTGFAPRRTVYLAFGHDEEIGGEQGAKQIAALLASRGVHLDFTLDEGGAITQGLIPGIGPPVAAIMAAEKGYLSLALTARGPGGHSSTPSGEAAIARLARGLARLEERPMPARLVPPVAAMLERLAPHMGLSARVAIANRWLLEPLLLRQLAATPVGNALVRTTTAPTLLQAGIKDNVLPGEARAVVNFRLLPGDQVEDVERHVRETLDDPAIAIERFGSHNGAAPPVSATDTPAFALLERAVHDVFPRTLVASGIILATTDNRHYAQLRDHGYYFLPFLHTRADQDRIHGTDERISVAGYADMVRFYVRVLQHAAGSP